MGAITVVGHLLPAGSRVVVPHDCYGGTFRLFTAWQKRGELAVDFVNFGDQAAVDAALAKPAALVWIETPSNPLLRITDIADIARRSHAQGALVVVWARCVVAGYKSWPLGIPRAWGVSMKAQ